MRAKDGSPTIANSAGRPWPKKIWTGRWQTCAYTTKPSRAGPEQSLDARSACKTATRQLIVRTTPTVHTWGGSQTYQLGQHSSRPTSLLHPGPPRRRSAAASTKGDARANAADIAMPAVRATMQTSYGPDYYLVRGSWCHQFIHSHLWMNCSSSLLLVVWFHGDRPWVSL